VQIAEIKDIFSKFVSFFPRNLARKIHHPHAKDNCGKKCLKSLLVYINMSSLFGFRSENYNLRVHGIPLMKTLSFKSLKGGLRDLRKASLSLESYSYKLGIDFHDYIRGKDFGDVKRPSMRLIENLVKKDDKVFILLGGEHTISVPAVKALKKNVRILYFDAHADLRDEFQGTKYSHACALKRIKEINENVMLIGVRSVGIEETSELEKVNHITANELRTKKKRSLKRITEFTKGEKIYVSFDVDVLDPSIAPGVGTPEPNGLLINDAEEIIDCIKGKIIGMDFVEFGTDPMMLTAITTAHIIRSFLFRICLDIQE
jgi:agmatinase